MGIDVSENNGELDFQSIIDAGVEFIIIRSSYGLYSEDGCFVDNINNALEVGLKFGIYHYSYALSVDDAQQEADHVIEMLQNYGVNPELGVWFDMEDADGYKSRNGMPDNQTITDMCKTFVNALTNAGYKCGIYASYSWLVNTIDLSQLPEVPLWNAQWGESNDLDSQLWQYTDSLEINGRNFDGNEGVDF